MQSVLEERTKEALALALRARRRANEALHGAHTGSLLCLLEAHAQMVHDQVGDGANPCVTLWLRGCLQLDLLRLLPRPVAYSEALAIALSLIISCDSRPNDCSSCCQLTWSPQARTPYRLL